MQHTIVSSHMLRAFRRTRDKGELYSPLFLDRPLCHTDLMYTTRRQLCFMGPALCATPIFGSAVEKLCGTASPSSAVNQEGSFPSKDLINQVIGASHEIAAQLMVIAGWTDQVQQKLEYADAATLKGHLQAVQEASQRASVVLNLMRNEIRTKYASPRARRSRPPISNEKA
jgi:hypothetical protein